MIENWNRLKSMTWHIFSTKVSFRFPLACNFIRHTFHLFCFECTKHSTETPSESLQERWKIDDDNKHFSFRKSRWICWVFFWLIKLMIYCKIIIDDKCRLDWTFFLLKIKNLIGVRRQVDENLNCLRHENLTLWMNQNESYSLRAKIKNKHWLPTWKVNRCETKARLRKQEIWEVASETHFIATHDSSSLDFIMCF